MNKNSLSRKSQHDFCKRKSWLTNVLNLFKGINKQEDEDDPANVTYLNFQIVHEKFLHKRLFKKLNCHRIVGKFLLQTEIQFKAKKQKVGLTGHFSGWKKVGSGIPRDHC